MPIVTADELSQALGQLGELREEVERLRAWREDIQDEADFMAQLTARARSRRQDRLRLAAVLGGLATVGIQFATLALIVLRHGG